MDVNICGIVQRNVKRKIGKFTNTSVQFLLLQKMNMVSKCGGMVPGETSLVPLPRCVECNYKVDIDFIMKKQVDVMGLTMMRNGSDTMANLWSMANNKNKSLAFQTRTSAFMADAIRSSKQMLHWRNYNRLLSCYLTFVTLNSREIITRRNISIDQSEQDYLKFENEELSDILAGFHYYEGFRCPKFCLMVLRLAKRFRS